MTSPYGILVKNDSGHVLVSADAAAFHYFGYAQFVGRMTSEANSLTDFPSYALDNSTNTLTGRTVWRYKTHCPGTPWFFIRPKDAGWHFYGILRQFKYGAYWYVDVIDGSWPGNSPHIIVFYRLENTTTPASQYGIVTRTDDGNLAFDSNRHPLGIRGAISVRPPYFCCDGGDPTLLESTGFEWRDNFLDFNFRCGRSSNHYVLDTDIPRDNLAYSAPAIAQGVWSRVKYGYKKSDGYPNDQVHKSTAVWWAMYHQAYRTRVDRYNRLILDAGWAVFAADYWYYEWWSDGGWFGGDGGSWETGNQPYEDKTINWGYNTVTYFDWTAYPVITRTDGPVQANPPNDYLVFSSGGYQGDEPQEEEPEYTIIYNEYGQLCVVDANGRIVQCYGDS